jgi:hypothetical protein
MQPIPLLNCVEEVATLAAVRISTIRCYEYPPVTAAALWPKLSPARELTAQAMILLMRVDVELREARADWNEDRFRRLMRIRPRAVVRLRRRWERLNAQPRLPLGSLRRRYHANIAGYLNSHY